MLEKLISCWIDRMIDRQIHRRIERWRKHRDSTGRWTDRKPDGTYRRTDRQTNIRMGR